MTHKAFLKVYFDLQVANTQQAYMSLKTMHLVDSIKNSTAQHQENAHVE